MDKRKRKQRQSTLIGKQPTLYCGPGNVCKTSSRTACAAIAASGRSVDEVSKIVDNQKANSTEAPKELLGM